MNDTTQPNHPDLWLHHFHWPSANQHKYDRGHVLVWGGPRMVGAARLAARAAARAGAGLVTLQVPASVWPVYAAHVMSVMANPLPDDSPQALQNAWANVLVQAHWRALVLGPGAGAGLPGDAKTVLRELVYLALATPGDAAVVLDADALMAFESCAPALMQAVQRSTHTVVMTPHEGEFARLFGHKVPSTSDDKVRHTRLAAQQSGATVVHKGAQTVLASPDGRVVVSNHAPPWLATGGTGDVLTGFMAALSAQGMPAMEAACMAVSLHGACAKAIGPGLLAEDLPEQVPWVLQALKPVELTSGPTDKG